MTPARFQKLCLSFPGATESVQWGEDHVFKVGAKMFAVCGFHDGNFHGISFKAAPESFHILTKIPGIVPAPYLARAGWVALDDLKALPADQLAAYVERSYRLVLDKLPKATRLKLAAVPQDARPSRARIGRPQPP